MDNTAGSQAQQPQQAWAGVTDEALLAMYGYSSQLGKEVGDPFDRQSRRTRSDTYHATQEITALMKAELDRRGVPTKEV